MIACAISLIATPVQAGWKEFQSTLAGYRQCILKKRACTAQEKKALGAVVATLVTFAVALGGALGYKWYQEQMALSWDGIKKMVDTFDADVRTNLPTGKVVRFNMITLRKFQQAIVNRPLAAAERGRMVEEIEALTDSSGSLNKLFQFVTQQGGLTYGALQDTIQGTLREAGIVAGNVYLLFGLDKKQGKQKSFQEMLRAIDDTIDQDLLKRQLRYLFRDAKQKQLFDAFLEGSDAVAAMPQASLELQRQQIDIITPLISALDDLKRK